MESNEWTGKVYWNLLLCVINQHRGNILFNEKVGNINPRKGFFIVFFTHSIHLK